MVLKTAKILSILLLAAIFIFSLSACRKGTDDKVIVFGTTADFPPFEFTVEIESGALGKYDGIDMAIAKQIADDNGKTAIIENMGFDELVDSLKNGHIDAIVAAMTITDKYEDVEFSIPYFTATQVMVVKNSSEIKSASDMKDYNVAAVRNYSGEEKVKLLGLEYQVFSRVGDAVLAVHNGEVDVAVIDSATAESLVKEYGGALKIVKDAKAFGEEQYGIAVKKGNRKLLDRINDSLEAMLEDGRIEELTEEYLTNE